MTPCVIDASVAAKWFFEEEHSAAARSLLGDEIQHLAPDFLLIEFGNVVAKRARRGDISADSARSAVSRLPALLLLHDTSALIGAALELALAFDRSVYDSLYVALALRHGCKLVTADRRLYNALAASLSDTVLWIEDVSASAGD